MIEFLLEIALEYFFAVFDGGFVGYPLECTGLFVCFGAWEEDLAYVVVFSSPWVMVVFYCGGLEEEGC